ncbi:MULTISPECIES: LysE family translocator [unclassified Sinorhizobium]|uniref:LysE family translocator n=1 Tax=unclassified Sinorhizobium TaxID=2613772 RepID=UPI0024C2124A|nr:MULTISPECIES: LysE family translocator [unclassified Sinorhizobium]MDK1375942.1 LysE family translocator [Sinorhizobium sp. 6-70]MDK1477587.1 LysE family translocator [Sinorhizobium sp. 6-117]
MLDLTPYLPQLLVAWTAYIIAVVSPGPAVLAIIATSVSQGRKAGLALAFGVLSGSYTWAMLTASGLSALIRTYGQAIVFLKIAGACYLFWLAYNALRAAMRSEASRAALRVPPQMSLKKLYLKGLGIHLTNPKAIFAWIMLVSLGMPPGAPVTVTATFIGGCMLIGLVSFCGFAIVFSLSPVHRAYLKSRRVIESLMAGFFAFAGLKLLTARL